MKILELRSTVSAIKLNKYLFFFFGQEILEISQGLVDLKMCEQQFFTLKRIERIEKKSIEPSFGGLWNNIKYSTIHAIRDSEEKGYKVTGNIWNGRIIHNSSQFEKDINYRKLWGPHTR